jgi:alpha-ribazole phosphatase
MGSRCSRKRAPPDDSASHRLLVLAPSARLGEVDFGRWDGLPWSDIAWAEVAAWQEDLLHHAPGGGEPLLAVAARVQDFVREHSGDVLLVSHGGWINALRALPPGTTTLAAANWSAAPAHSSLTRWVVPARG